MVTGPVKPGEILWYAHNGATVKPLEVADNKCEPRTTDLIYVRTPGNLEKPPWHCWEGWLFRDRKEAYKQACKFCRDAIDSNNWKIGDLQKQNRMIRKQLDRLTKEAKRG